MSQVIWYTHTGGSDGPGNVACDLIEFDSSISGILMVSVVICEWLLLAVVNPDRGDWLSLTRG